MWVPDYSGEVRFAEGMAWGGKRLMLEPQFAGLSEEVIDRYTMSALQSMPHLYPGSRPEQLMPMARAAIKKLTQVDYNPTRLLWRMASLYISTVMVEQQGLQATIESTDDMPAIEYLEGLADASSMLVKAMTTQDQYLYVEAPKFNNDPKVMEIYQLLMSAKVRFTQTAEMMYPAVLNMWPAIPQAKVMLYGAEKIASAITQITSGQVALAIDAYIQQYGLVKQFEEILKTVAVFALRPRNDTIFCGHTEILMSLPRSQLEPAALGPLVVTVRHWERENAMYDFPRFSQLMWEGHARYMMWSLSHKQVLMRMGANLPMHTITDNQSFNAMRKIYSSRSDGNGVQILAALIMKGFGWIDGIGRILSTVIGQTKVRVSGGSTATFTTPLTSKYTVQWEEALPYVDKMPADAAVAAFMYPPTTAYAIPTKTWITTKYVHGSVTTAEAFYALVFYADAEIGYSRVALGDGTVRYRAIEPRGNYRDTYADNQFHISDVQKAEGYRVVARINSAPSALSAFLVTREAKKFEWFVEDYIFEASPLDDLETAVDETVSPDMVESEGFGGAVETKEDNALRLRELQALENAALEKAVKQITAKEAQPDPFVEAKIQWRAKQAIGQPIVEPDMLSVKARMVSTKLGFQPEWIEPLQMLQKMEKLNPIEFSRIAPGLAQQFLSALKTVDVREYPAFAEDRDQLDLTLRNMAGIIRIGAKYAPPGESQLDVLKIASGIDMMATAVGMSNNIVDINDYRAIIGQEPPKHVTDELFSEAIKAGIATSTIINSPDKEWLEMRIEEGIRDIELNAQKTLEEETGQTAEPPGEAESSGVAHEPTVKQLVIAETIPEAKQEVQLTGPEVSTSDFGSIPTLQGNGDTDQSQQPGPAQSATETGDVPTEMQFSASRETT